MKAVLKHFEERLAKKAASQQSKMILATSHDLIN